MRIWYLNPQFLDSARLTAAHQENHAFRTCVEKNRPWGNWLSLHGKHLNYTLKVHDQCVLEMAIRKGLIPHPGSCLVDLEQLAWQYPHILAEHPSPYDIFVFQPQSYLGNFQPTEEHLQKDVQDLRLKWETERYWNGMGRVCLTQLERQLNLPLGLTKQDATIQKEKARQVYQDHKVWFDSYRKTYPKSRMQDRFKAFFAQNGA